MPAAFSLDDVADSVVASLLSVSDEDVELLSEREVVVLSSSNELNSELCETLTVSVGVLPVQPVKAAKTVMSKNRMISFFILHLALYTLIIQHFG